MRNSRSRSRSLSRDSHEDLNQVEGQAQATTDTSMGTPTGGTKTLSDTGDQLGEVESGTAKTANDKHDVHENGSAGGADSRKQTDDEDDL